MLLTAPNDMAEQTVAIMTAIACLQGLRCWHPASQLLRSHIVGLLKCASLKRLEGAWSPSISESTPLMQPAHVSWGKHHQAQLDLE